MASDPLRHGSEDEVSSFDAIVLAGGRSSRLGGIDKATLTVGGTSLLERVLAAVAEAHRVICVGPERPTVRPVTWTHEEPSGGGPVAAVGAALELVSAPTSVVVAVDLPFLTGDIVKRLASACSEHQAALVSDELGVPQALVAAYRTDVLRARLALIGDLSGVAMREVIDGISYTLVPHPEVAHDCDTWADVEQARKLGGR